jgi:hypothetical protein
MGAKVVPYVGANPEAYAALLRERLRVLTSLEITR